MKSWYSFNNILQRFNHCFLFGTGQFVCFEHDFYINNNDDNNKIWRQDAEESAGWVTSSCGRSGSLFLKSY